MSDRSGDTSSGWGKAGTTGTDEVLSAGTTNDATANITLHTAIQVLQRLVQSKHVLQLLAAVHSYGSTPVDSTGDGSVSFLHELFPDSDGASGSEKELIEALRAVCKRFGPSVAASSGAREPSGPLVQEIGLEEDAKSISELATGPPTAEFAVGDTIQGNWQGQGRWYQGKIAGVKYVIPDDVVLHEATGVTAAGASSRGRAYKRAVMARAAVVRYDIWYKDGDRDMDVPPTHVRATRSTTTTPNKRASPDKGVPTHHRSPVSTVDAADVRENSDKALPLVDGATMAGVGQGVHIGAVFDGTGTTTSSVEHSVGSGGNNNDSNRGGGSEVASFEAGVGSGDTGRHVRVWETRKNLPPALRELLSFNSKGEGEDWDVVDTRKRKKTELFQAGPSLASICTAFYDKPRHKPHRSADADHHGNEKSRHKHHRTADGHNHGNSKRKRADRPPSAPTTEDGTAPSAEEDREDTMGEDSPARFRLHSDSDGSMAAETSPHDDPSGGGGRGGGGSRGKGRARGQVGAGGGAGAVTATRRVGRQVFTCRVCGRTFGHIGNCRSHEVTHERNPTLPTPRDTGDPNKPFGCEKCGKAFGRRVDLNIHFRAHANDNRQSIPSDLPRRPKSSPHENTPEHSTGNASKGVDAKPPKRELSTPDYSAMNADSPTLTQTSIATVPAPLRQERADGYSTLHGDDRHGSATPPAHSDSTTGTAVPKRSRGRPRKMSANEAPAHRHASSPVSTAPVALGTHAPSGIVGTGTEQRSQSPDVSDRGSIVAPHPRENQRVQEIAGGNGKVRNEAWRGVTSGTSVKQRPAVALKDRYLPAARHVHESANGFGHDRKHASEDAASVTRVTSTDTPTDAPTPAPSRPMQTKKAAIFSLASRFQRIAAAANKK